VTWMPALSPAEIERHNADVAALRQAYARDEHARVPVTVAFDEQYLLARAGVTFANYYGDVKTQLRVQLDSQTWVAENVLHDAPMGLPESFVVVPPAWMDENEFYGCAVTRQEDDYSWGQPLDMGRAELLEHLRGLNVEDRIRAGTLWRQYERMRELTDGLEHLGRPVTVPAPPIASTHGIFTKAVELRGGERLCLEMIDDPPFVDELLDAMTDLTIARIDAWARLCGVPRGGPSPHGFSLCDDSLTLLSPAQYARFVLPRHERIYAAMTTGTRGMHLCGKVQRLFPVLHRELGITVFDGPGTQVDIVGMIRDIGERVTIQAQVSHRFLAASRHEIESAVRRVLAPAAKNGARMTLLGYAVRGAPEANLRFFYDCAVRHGAVER
jgi:hypothetical protein